MAPPRLTGGNRLPAMIGRSWATVVGAAPAMGLLAMLMFTPLVCDPPGVPVDSSVQPQISLSASDVTAENHLPSTTVVRAEYAPPQSRATGGYPLRRRRRIHFWNTWTHYGGSGSPISWIWLGPLLAITLGAIALPFYLLYLRGRRKRKQARRDAGAQPLEHTPPAFGTEVLTPHTTPTTYVPTTTYAAPHAEQSDDRLSRLSALHASGALTDEEFETQRRRILGG